MPIHLQALAAAAGNAQADTLCRLLAAEGRLRPRPGQKILPALLPKAVGGCML